MHIIYIFLSQLKLENDLISRSLEKSPFFPISGMLNHAPVHKKQGLQYLVETNNSNTRAFKRKCLQVSQVE